MKYIEAFLLKDRQVKTNPCPWLQEIEQCMRNV